MKAIKVKIWRMAVYLYPIRWKSSEGEIFQKYSKSSSTYTGSKKDRDTWVFRFQTSNLNLCLLRDQSHEEIVPKFIWKRNLTGKANSYYLLCLRIHTCFYPIQETNIFLIFTWTKTLRTCRLVNSDGQQCIFWCTLLNEGHKGQDLKNGSLPLPNKMEK